MTWECLESEIAEEFGEIRSELEYDADAVLLDKGAEKNRQSAERMREVRAWNVALGLCQCGRERKPGVRWCEVCCRVHTASRRAVQERRRESGLCWRCGGPLTGELKTCDRCAAMQRIRIKAWRRSRRRQGLCSCFPPRF